MFRDRKDIIRESDPEEVLRELVEKENCDPKLLLLIAQNIVAKAKIKDLNAQNAHLPGPDSPVENPSNISLKYVQFLKKMIGITYRSTTKDAPYLHREAVIFHSGSNNAYNVALKEYLECHERPSDK